MKHRIVLIMLILCVLGNPVTGRNLRLIDPDGVDTADISSLIATVMKGCQNDQEKMIALWAYITRNPYYHWCEARENPEGTTEFGVVIDPITAFNVYGTVICYQVDDILSNLADAAGMTARTRMVPGHQVMETFYDRDWHLFDAQYDLQAYYVADDGHAILSLEELCQDAGKYIRDPKYPSQPFFQFDRYGGKFWPWESKEYVIRNFFQPDVPAKAPICAPLIVRGHTIDLDLRRGETLIRYFTNEEKWFCPPDFYATWKRDTTQRFIDAGPHDPRNPANTYANGTLVYEPDWNHKNNFYDGLYSGKGYFLNDGKVYPKSCETAQVIFRIQSPYLIVGNPGELEVDGDSHNGAIFQAEFFRKDDSALNSVAVSTDNGLSWNEIWKNDRIGTRTVRLDLTNRVEGTYGYLIKVTLQADQSESTSLSEIRLCNHLFLSPIPLPAIKTGENRFTFSLEEEKGTLNLRPDLGNENNYHKYFHEISGLEYSNHFTERLSPIAGGEGYATIEVAAPVGSKLEWLTIHGSFGEDVGDDNAESVEILYRTARNEKWQSAWKSDFSARNDKWRWDSSVDVYLDPPAEKCFVKFLLKRNKRISLNMVKIYAHLLRPAPSLNPESVTIIHNWNEDGKARMYSIQPDLNGQTYTILSKGKAIENQSISIAVAND